MSVLGILIMYCGTYFLIKLINYHATRKESLKVMRWHEYRYFKSGLYKNLRAYFVDTEKWPLNFYSFIILSVQLLVLFINTQYLISGGNYQALLCFGGMSLNLMMFYLIRKNDVISSYIYESHFLLSIFYISLLIFLPTLSYLVPSALISLFSFLLLPISILISYQIMRLVFLSREYKFGQMLNTMFVFLLLAIQYTFVFSDISYGPAKFLVVWLHAMLTTIILASYYRNTVDLKAPKKTSKHIYAVGVYAALILVFLFGGMLWQ